MRRSRSLKRSIRGRRLRLFVLPVRFPLLCSPSPRLSRVLVLLRCGRSAGSALLRALGSSRWIPRSCHPDPPSPSLSAPRRSFVVVGHCIVAPSLFSPLLLGFCVRRSAAVASPLLSVQWRVIPTWHPDAKCGWVCNTHDTATRIASGENERGRQRAHRHSVPLLFLCAILLCLGGLDPTANKGDIEAYFGTSRPIKNIWVAQKPPGTDTHTENTPRDPLWIRTASHRPRVLTPPLLFSLSLSFVVFQVLHSSSF